MNSSNTETTNIPAVREDITVKISNTFKDNTIEFPNELESVEYMKLQKEQLADSLSQKGFEDSLPLDLENKNENLWHLVDYSGQVLICYEIIDWKKH